MPQASDLTTLQGVKMWAFGDGSNSPWPQSGAGLASLDIQLGALITAASRAALSLLQRPNILYRTVNEMRDGTSTPWLLLREWPVSSIQTLFIGNIAVPARPNLTASSAVSTSPYGPAGYVLEPWDGNPPGKPQKLSCDGFRYHGGNFNVSISYSAGYAVIGEAATPVAAGTAPNPAVPYVIPAQPWGRWAADISVSYAGGAALTRIPAGGTPTVGQYIAPSYPASLQAPVTFPAFYTFNAADVGANLLISYSATPWDLDQAVAKWVGEWMAYRTRRGEKSKALPSGGGTATFDLSAMPEDVKMMLNFYRKAIPL